MAKTAKSAVLELGDLKSEQLQQKLLDKIAEGVYCTDLERHIAFWNRAARRLTGFTARQVLGTCCADDILKHVDEAGNELCTTSCPLSSTIVDGKSREVNVFLHHKKGHRVPVCVRTVPLRNRGGAIVGAIETFTDNTTHMADLERIRRLEKLAYVDELTNLANRRYLQDAMNSRLAELRRHGTPFGLMALDVDGLKTVNDRYGHDLGDRMLTVVAQTLSHNCREYDLAGRWGGDEFLLLASYATPAELAALAERLLVLIWRSFIIADEKPLSVTASAGLTAARAEDETESICKRVDQLLYHSKTDGRNRITTDFDSPAAAS